MTVKDKTFHVYELVDPRDGSVRYVGCTVNPKSRLRQHCSCDNNVNRHKNKWIEELKALGRVPILRVVHTCTDGKEAATKEHDLIEAHLLVGNTVYCNPHRYVYSPKKPRSGPVPAIAPVPLPSLDVMKHGPTWAKRRDAWLKKQREKPQKAPE